MSSLLSEVRPSGYGRTNEANEPNGTTATDDTNGAAATDATNATSETDEADETNGGACDGAGRSQNGSYTR